MAWAAAQPRGRYELVGVEVVAMVPERARHNIVKLAVARALDEAVKRAGLKTVEVAAYDRYRRWKGRNLTRLADWLALPALGVSLPVADICRWTPLGQGGGEAR